MDVKILTPAPLSIPGRGEQYKSDVVSLLHGAEKGRKG
jgi:hypothetical protein